MISHNNSAAGSSHTPQNPKPLRQLSLLVPGSLLWLLSISSCSHPEEQDVKPVVAVRVTQARMAAFEISVTAPATLYPRQQANVASRITAPIRELRARKGDSVSFDQVLAVLENQDLEAQRQEAAAVLLDAQANLEKVTSGTLPIDVARARGQVAMDQAALNQAQKYYDRRSELFKEGAIPERDLLASQTELTRAKTGFEVSKKSLELLENQSRDRDIRMAESRLAQAKAHLQLVNAQLQFSELRSPFAGTLTEQFLYPGDMAKPEIAIFTVMDLSSVVARAQVPEEQAGDIQVGQTGQFQPTDRQAEKFQGRISVLNKAVDPARRTVEVWCEIPNTAYRLRSGVFGSLTIVTGKIPQGIVIPLNAIQFQSGTRKGWVMVVDEKHISHRREIEAGELSGGAAQIKQGLKVNERVIVEGGYGLPEGTEVKFSQETH